LDRAGRAQAETQARRLDSRVNRRIAVWVKSRHADDAPKEATDIKIDGSNVTTPKVVVHAKGAEDCVRLARAVLSLARPFVTHSAPVIRTAAQDEFFALKPPVFKQMSKTSDFWWYHISRIEAGAKALEHAATEYHENYFLKSVRYKPEAVPE
jgi:hypothetical protein